jgi:hypothetical protein
VVAALALTQAALLGRTAWDKSDTIDEPYYLESALSQWTRREFRRGCDTPALPKWGFALGLRLVDPRLFEVSRPGGRHPLWSRSREGGLRRNLLAARAATIVVTLAGGLFLWAAARRFGEGTALLAHALWCVSPTVLAHGSLATLDAWAACLICAVIWAGVRLSERPNLGRAALVGALMGLAAACKVTTLGVAVPLAVATIWSTRRRATALLSLGFTAVAAMVIALWAVYGFTVGPLDTAHLCGRDTELRPRRWGPLPFPAWWEGLLLQVLHGEKGHLSYLFGEVGSEGWWWFYLAALALKTTVGAQGLIALRGASWLRARPSAPAGAVDLVLLAYPAVLVAVMSLGRAQNGIKYLLPAFPFLILLGARALPDARRAFGRRGAAAVAGLLALSAVESLAVHPHHLMFFNLWAGGPEGGPRYLVHGDDWGQDQRRLGEWQRANRPWRLFYTYYNGDPPHWGIAAETPPCQPQPGFYALHAVEVHRPKRLPAGCLDWLTVEPPDARLGYSIYLYQVTRARIDRLQGERDLRKAFWRSAPPASAPAR